MKKNTLKLVKELYELYDLSYIKIAPQVEAIMISKSRDINLIEYYLDQLLNIPTDKAYKMLKRLCDYCKDIDPEIAKFYMDEYVEMYEPKKNKKKKRKKT